MTYTRVPVYPPGIHRLSQKIPLSPHHRKHGTKFRSSAAGRLGDLQK